ncbi:MAG: site-specific DNA-methyltransferase [Cytophagales bacterium]|nr:site-specific DNA-methyltransferase [Cytophagales bacterium]
MMLRRIAKKEGLNVEPGTIFIKDNLSIMRCMNSDCIDLIYLDPPFNKNKTFTALMDSKAKGAEFKDYWERDDVKDADMDYLEKAHEELFALLKVLRGLGIRGSEYYLYYIALRLLECHRVLKPTGSIYLHCDPTMSHYLKLLMDCIFGVENFRNEIVWFYPDTPGRARRYFPKKHDLLLCYSKSRNYTFEAKNVLIDILPESKMRYKTPRKIGGREYIGGKSSTEGKIPEDVWRIPAVKGNSKEYIGYPTQKPEKLLDRIIKASSQEGDVVLDPFCGCATTCVVAHGLHRKWIGIDLSPVAGEMVLSRLHDRGSLDYKIVIWNDKTNKADVLPVRTDLRDIPSS